jgi:hypothetical protein
MTEISASLKNNTAIHKYAYQPKQTKQRQYIRSLAHR